MDEITKKYQVFVSSTYEDLKSARRAVYDALLRADCIPAGMELFSAGDETQWEMIRRSIDLCDYYLVIIAGRYGSTTAEGISYTETEYRYAVEQKIPVAAFILNVDAQWPLQLVEVDSRQVKKLEAFKKLAKTKPVSFWSNEIELALQVTNALTNMKQRNPRPGWIRKDDNNRKVSIEPNFSLKFAPQDSNEHLRFKFLPLPMRELRDAQRERDQEIDSRFLTMQAMSRLSRDSAARYAASLEKYCDLVARVVQIELIAENFGTELIEDVDVEINLPDEFSAFDEIPDLPKKPDQFGQMQYSIPSMGSLVNRIDPKAVSGPEVDNQIVRFHIPRVKRGKPVILPAFYLKFANEVNTGVLDYRVISAHPHGETGGQLRVPVQFENEV